MSGGRLAIVVLGFLLLAVAGYFYLASGLVVPMPYLAVLWVAWLVMAGVAIAKRREPGIVMAMGITAAVFWFAFVQGLGSLLDWSG